MARMKGILIFILCIIVMLGTCESVNAEILEVAETEIEVETGEGVIDEPIGSLINFNENTRGASKPGSSSVWNLSSKGEYTFDFSAWSGTGCYSGYNFTGVSKIRLFINASSVNNNGNACDYTVKVYKRGSVSDSCIATYTRNTGTDHKTAMVFSVDSSSKYYFRILTSYQIKGSGYIREY